MTCTKAGIIDHISSEGGLNKKKAGAALESTLEIIKQALELGEDVLISGFGKFCVKEKGKRRGSNPSTGSDLMLDARRVVIFRCSPLMKRKTNGKRR